MDVIKYQIMPTGKLSKLKFDEVWGARSESRKDKIYTVALDKKGKWSCSCPRWTQNASRPECKHIKFIKVFRVNGFKREDEVEAPEQVIATVSRFANIEV